MTRYISKKDKELAIKSGKIGEELIDKYLHERKSNSLIDDYKWVAKKIPSADHDFEVTELNGQIKMIEVKSTIGDFEKPFYWSKNERSLFLHDARVYIFKRVYNVLDAKKVSFIPGENMISLKNNLKSVNISGLVFDKSIIHPNKIDISWNKEISLSKYY